MLVADCLTALRKASIPPVDWEGFREAKTKLDVEATTARQKAALANLSSAGYEDLHTLLVAVENEFPTPFLQDASGWPRLNPAFQRSGRRR